MRGETRRPSLVWDGMRSPAVAMQTGMGLSKILILVGAGYTSTILVKNDKLSDILGEIQSLVKGMEKNGESSKSDSDVFDAIASQVAFVGNLFCLSVHHMLKLCDIEILLLSPDSSLV
ncbi:hypothetical protein LOK49_LG05G02241 [Camellia lanceoleosa]|uniref:Uncharacterized protein n=1 Tax=Camellia lanceoleosa TaxID=1840588 RepID=A0ACC0HLT7_9ERIC|nr:hypothetical protein LOK49_LG05G02241 [Camellia lanceoleosa]